MSNLITKNKINFILVAIVFYIIATICLSPTVFKNSSTSMSPNIIPKSYCLSYKKIGHYKNNEIVVATVNLKQFNLSPNQNVIKRIIASKGDLVEVKNKSIYVNGSLLHKDIGNNSSNLKIVVPQNYYFLLGDNYLDSFDSRNYGIIHKNKILGKVIFTINWR